MRFSAIFLLQKRLTITDTVGKLSFNGYFSLAFPGSRSTIQLEKLFCLQFLRAKKENWYFHATSLKIRLSTKKPSPSEIKVGLTQKNDDEKLCTRNAFTLIPKGDIDFCNLETLNNVYVQSYVHTK